MSYILDALNKQESDASPKVSPQNQPGEQPRQRSWLPIVGLALLANAVIAGIWLWQGQTPDTSSQDSAEVISTQPKVVEDAADLSAAGATVQPDGAPGVIEQRAIEQRLAPDDGPVTTFDEMQTPSVEPLTASRPAQPQPTPTQSAAPSGNGQLTITTQPGEVVISPPGARPIIIEEGATADSVGIAPEETVAAATPQDAATPEPIKQVSVSRASFITFAELDGATRARFPEIDVSTHIYAEEADLRAVVFERRRLQEGDTIAGLPLVHITEAGLIVRFEGQLIELSVLDDWEGY